MIQGTIAGVFGTDSAAKSSFMQSVAKKSEADGLTVYHATVGGKRLTLLDDDSFPQRIQGYSRIASISDHALYLLPQAGRLGTPDGELAVLLDALCPSGTVVAPRGAREEEVRRYFTGTALERYSVVTGEPASSLAGSSAFDPRRDMPDSTLVYIDRAFSVKGVGTVALGFVLSGTVSLHDRLRTLPVPEGTSVEVRGIQVNDQDFEEVGRGMRVGLLLKGVEPAQLGKTSWLDDWALPLRRELQLGFSPSPFYRQSVEGRGMHVHLAGETLQADIGRREGRLLAVLNSEVPVWQGMRAAIIDLNGKGLRVAGGGQCNF